MEKRESRLENMGRAVQDVSWGWNRPLKSRSHLVLWSKDDVKWGKETLSEKKHSRKRNTQEKETLKKRDIKEK